MSDREIRFGTSTLENNVFVGQTIGVEVLADGEFKMRAPIPPELVAWFA